MEISAGISTASKSEGDLSYILQDYLIEVQKILANPALLHGIAVKAYKKSKMTEVYKQFTKGKQRGFWGCDSKLRLCMQRSINHTVKI